MWDYGSSKALEPDGFTFKFFKEHLTTIEHDVISYLRHFEVLGLIPRGCNSSFITLVLKVDDPLVVGDFRPISLIGYQYQIIVKILANRLSQVVSLVAGDVQMAYIKGHQIIDGTQMVDVIISWAKKQKRRLLFLKCRFYTKDNALWSKVICSIYGPTGGLHYDSLLKPNLGPWYHILKLKDDLLAQGRVMNRRMPTRINLDHRGIALDSVRCPMCDDDLETEDHVFVTCKIAADVWKQLQHHVMLRKRNEWIGIQCVSNKIPMIPFELEGSLRAQNLQYVLSITYAS
nr:transposon TX1 uncharacterized [Tanacetum cinerariifolium]